MEVTMLKDRLTAPFVHPRGISGRLAARIMDRGNAEANHWAVDLLKLSDSDQFIDVGCGPGVAVHYAATHSPALAVGIDPAPVMIDHAMATDAADGGRSTVEFKVAPAEKIPYPNGAFTRGRRGQLRHDLGLPSGRLYRGATRPGFRRSAGGGLAGAQRAGIARIAGTVRRRRIR